MAVTIKYGPPKPIAYKAQLVPTVNVLKPIIDTIAITCRAEAAYDYIVNNTAEAKLPTQLTDPNKFWLHIWKQLQLAASSDEFEQLLPAPKERKLPQYRNNIVANLPGVSTQPLLSFPSNLKKAPVRLQINPAKLGLDGLIKLESTWDAVVGEFIPFRALFKEAIVTRLDTAVDLLGCDASDILIHHQKVWKIWIATHPDTGVQTKQFYIKHSNQKSPFSRPNGRAHLTVYDKRAEQIAKNLEPPYGDSTHIRIERSQVTKQPVEDLLKLKPAFGGWTIVLLSKTQDFTKEQWLQYADSISARGIASASKLHPGMPSTFTEIRKAHIGIIKDDLWNQWNENHAEGVLGKLAQWANQEISDHFAP
ncbi:hypothetical protein ACQKH5_01655 [Hyphomonas sp. NPDC076900]|uniref:hypothetical protein n=1 Tax=unclassified Hyphomonas TaxID=2630699 RepID=UPI003CFE060D